MSVWLCMRARICHGSKFTVLVIFACFFFCFIVFQEFRDSLWWDEFSWVLAEKGICQRCQVFRFISPLTFYLRYRFFRYSFCCCSCSGANRMSLRDNMGWQNCRATLYNSQVDTFVSGYFWFWRRKKKPLQSCYRALSSWSNCYWRTKEEKYLCIVYNAEAAIQLSCGKIMRIVHFRPSDFVMSKWCTLLILSPTSIICLIRQNMRCARLWFVLVSEFVIFVCFFLLPFYLKWCVHIRIKLNGTFCIEMYFDCEWPKT